MSNIERSEKYIQVCVWPGTIVKKEQVSEFEEYFRQNGFRVKFLETIETEPDRDDDGYKVKETGGRIDAFFAVHNDDVMMFAMPRLQMGIRWIEDVLDNEARFVGGESGIPYSIYPDRVKEYRTW